MLPSLFRLKFTILYFIWNVNSFFFFPNAFWKLIFLSRIVLIRFDYLISWFVNIFGHQLISLQYLDNFFIIFLPSCYLLGMLENQVCSLFRNNVILLRSCLLELFFSPALTFSANYCLSSLSYNGLKFRVYIVYLANVFYFSSIIGYPYVTYLLLSIQ